MSDTSFKNLLLDRNWYSFYGRHLKFVCFLFLYKQYTGNLELVVQWYNKIKQTVLEVEYPLIEKELIAADNQLKEAEEKLTWQKENCWEYIEFIKAKVHDLEQRLQKSKDNIKTIQQIMQSWMEQPFFSRKDNRKEALLNLDDKENKVAKKFMSFQEDGYKMHKLVEVISSTNFHEKRIIYLISASHLHIHLCQCVDLFKYNYQFRVKKVASPFHAI